MSTDSFETILYILEKEWQLDSILRSIRSLKQYMPNAKVVLYTNITIQPKLLDGVVIVDNEEKFKEISWDRLLYLHHSVFVLSGFEELFSLMDRFEYALPLRVVSPVVEQGREWFKEQYESSVILFHKRSWNSQSLELLVCGLSETLVSELLDKTHLRGATMSQRYCFNSRCCFVSGKVKILALGENTSEFLSEICPEINSSINRRGILLDGSKITVSDFAKTKSQDFDSDGLLAATHLNESDSFQVSHSKIIEKRDLQPFNSTGKGVIYVATGKKMALMACNSAKSLKKHNPGISVTLFTSEKIHSSVFNQVVEIQNPRYGFGDKVDWIDQSPYNETIFLDADTTICGDLRILYDYLDWVDIAVAFAPSKNGLYSPGGSKDDDPDLSEHWNGMPISFTQFNTGILVFKKSKRMEAFWIEWRELNERYYKSLVVKGKGINDELPFTYAMWLTKVRYAVLPENFNLISECGFLKGRVSIFHAGNVLNGDHRISREIVNSSEFFRVYEISKSITRVSIFRHETDRLYKYLEMLRAKQRLCRFLFMLRLSLSNSTMLFCWILDRFGNKHKQ